MISSASLQTLFTNFGTNTGLMIVVAVGIVLGGLGSLIGLGFAVRKIKRYVTGRKF